MPFAQGNIGHNQASCTSTRTGSDCLQSTRLTNAALDAKVCAATFVASEVYVNEFVLFFRGERSVT